MTKHLYRYYDDFGRMGELKSLFIASENDMKMAWNRTIYMHDILGKHSEIPIIFDEETIEVVDVPQDFVEKLEHLLGRNLTDSYDFLESILESIEEEGYEDDD